MRWIIILPLVLILVACERDYTPVTAFPPPRAEIVDYDSLHAWFLYECAHVQLSDSAGLQRIVTTGAPYEAFLDHVQEILQMAVNTSRNGEPLTVYWFERVHQYGDGLDDVKFVSHVRMER